MPNVSIEQDRVLVGKRSELVNGTRKVVSLPDGRDIGVIVHDDEIYAYRNRCMHQGGPVAEGLIIGRVMARLGADGQMLGEEFNEEEPHLICPWHGVEYQLKGGQCVTNPKARLIAHEIVVDGDDVFLVI